MHETKLSAKRTVLLHEYAHATVFINMLWTDAQLSVHNQQRSKANGAFKSSPWAITLKTPVENISPLFFIAIYVDSAYAAQNAQSIKAFLPVFKTASVALRETKKCL